jgi:L-iditol 2-dehydrogenase
MKAMQLTGIRQMRITEVPDPVITDPGEVLVRVRRVGICGSDVHYYTTGRIGSQVVEYPFTVGHEGAGVVEAVGETVTDLSPGAPVAIEPAMSCHACDQCRAGREHTCRNLRFLGCPGQASGCMSEYVVMPRACCLPLAEGMTLERGVLAEPLAIGVYAVQQSVPMQGARIGILGSGPIGLSVLAAAKAAGAAAAYVTDRIDSRCEAARAAGAAWAGNPDREDVNEAVTEREPLLLDAVFECAGQQETLDQAVGLVKPGGKAMIIGIPEFERYTFAADIARRKEVCLQHVRRQNDCAEKTLQMLTDGTIDIDAMVTHRVPLEECQKGFDLVDRYEDGVIKAMITLD